MKILFLIFFLPICLIGQTIPDPIDNNPGDSENTDGLAGDDVSTVTLTIDGDITITGNLTITGGALWPPSYTEPDPDSIPGPNPLPPAQNENPVAAFTYSPISGDFPLLVNADGTTSTDSDGTISSYSWNWGDGTITTGSTSSHTYTVAGNYGIVLTVTDDDGATSITQPKTVNVTTAPVNQNPVALFTTDVTTGTSPLTVNVDASTSYDTDGTIADPAGYVWDFDTGSPTSGTGSTDSTTFTGAGIYTITLTVTDDDTDTGVATKQIEVAAAPVNPVASFTVTPTSGNIPFTVDVDASASTDPDGTISSYSWDWGDATANGSGVTASHTYTTANTFTITLTVTDNSALTGDASSQVQSYTGGLPEYDMTTVEVGYRHVSLSWEDVETWNKPWLIQRSTTAAFTDPTDMTDNQDDDNTGVGTFRFLGINADNYIDIDDLAEGTQYYYRAGTVTNLSEHYQDGATPTFGPWIYGTATTTTLAAGKKLTYDITSYGAVAGDGLNDKPAIDTAFAAAQAAGGGIIYFPAGTYDVWPTDADVDIVNGYPEIESGESVSSSLWNITSDNITFLGDASGGVPTTFVDLYLWGKEPATKWLNVLSGASGSAVSNVKRYFVFLTSDVENFTVKNLDIDMGAVPVSTSKNWQTLDAKRYEWDVSHKLLASFNLQRFKNVVFDTVHSTNCRGEVIYNGGGSEKILVKDCDLRQNNSSTISGSFDLELVNTTIADSANSAVESNLLNDRISFFTGETFPQNHIARGVTFIGLDQSANGVMKDLPGDTNAFNGWLVFNESGTYQSVTDSSFRDHIQAYFGPWYEYRNGFRFNCDFTGFGKNTGSHMFYTWTSEQTDYTLAGGMSEIYWLGDTINMNADWPNYQVFFYSQPGGAALGNESPWIWEAVHFTGGFRLNRLWVDTWNLTSGRQNAVFKDWTYDPGVTFDPGMFQFLGANHISPQFINFLE